jgi:hypothetical protein
MRTSHRLALEAEGPHVLRKQAIDGTITNREP